MRLFTSVGSADAEADLLLFLIGLTITLPDFWLATLTAATLTVMFWFDVCLFPSLGPPESDLDLSSSILRALSSLLTCLSLAKLLRLNTELDLEVPSSFE